MSRGRISAREPRCKRLAWAFSWLCAAFGPTTASGASAMVAYGESGSANPKYRIWNGTSWGSEASASVVADVPYWISFKGSPIEDHFVLATLDNAAQIKLQTWNGSSWSGAFTATSDAGDKSTRMFDVAYEHSSGHILAVYRRSGTSAVCYRTYNGSSWSSESTYSIGAGILSWLALTANTGTDEIMLIACGESGSRAAMWNGSSFSNQTTLYGSAAPEEFKQFSSGAFERASGQGLAGFFDGDSAPGYRTLTGGAWSAAQNAPSVGGQAKWLELAADTASDRIIMATLDDTDDINVNLWNGSAWGTNFQAEDTSSSISRGFDLIFEKGGTQALLVFHESTSTVRYRTWDGFSWSANLAGPGGGNLLWTIQAVAGLDNGQVFVTFCNDTPEIRTVVWNGSSFGSVLNLGTSSAPKEYEPFMAATSRYQVAPKVTLWREIKR